MTNNKVYNLEKKKYSNVLSSTSLRWSEKNALRSGGNAIKEILKNILIDKLSLTFFDLSTYHTDHN